MNEFHSLQIRIAGVVLLLSLALYTFGPADRIQLAHDIALVTLAFLFGKFTNGFTRKHPTRWDDKPEAKLNGDGETARKV